MQRQLVIIDGPDQGRTFSLEDGQTLVVGRSMTSDTKINDPRMSRVHCRVQVDGGTTLLIDAGSSSGTLIGGDRVTQHELHPGDVFQVGNSHIRYQLDSLREATTVVGEQMFGRPKPPLKDLVGQTLARYRLDKIVFQGQSGMVFKGHDTEKERVCAIKVLTPDPAHSDEQRDRFVRAMKTMLNIHHNHIVQLYAAGKKGPYWGFE